MTYPNQLFVDGRFIAGGAKPAQLVNPATENVITEVQSASVQDVDRAVQTAQKAWEGGWRDLAPGKRSEILYAVSRALKARIEDLARMEMEQMGKPIADARDEAGLGARVFEYYAGALTKLFGQVIPVSRGGFDFTLRQSMGVVAAIVPWNFPFPIAAWKVAPALAAGNCVILKPATLSPLTALALGQIAHEAGLPPGVLQVLPGSGGVMGETLSTHPLIRKISFTGSTEVGKRIMELAARDIKRVSLELGGKSPNIVFADADWQKAAECSPMSVFANTGQDCCARSRMFVEASVYDGFVQRFVESTRKLVVGDPSLESTQIGPLSSAAQRHVVEEFVGAARKTSSRILAGGERGAQPKGFYYQPTVMTDVGMEDRCWREEIFGPVVCIVPFNDESEMIREVNRTSFGLSGSLWTRDLSRALRVSRQVQSGVLSVNCHNSVHVEAPFGGFKASGLGRDLGMNALEGYTEIKNVYVAE